MFFVLLNPEKHLGFIDAVADNRELIDEYYSEFRSLNSIRKELNALEMDEDEKARKIDLLKYQINELETANLKIGEFEDLIPFAQFCKKSNISLIIDSSLQLGPNVP